MSGVLHCDWTLRSTIVQCWSFRPMKQSFGAGAKLTAWLENMMPDEYVTSIEQIDLDRLWRVGCRLILTDLDNTLVPWNHPSVPDKLSGWLQNALDRGFEVCIVSNNHGPRVAAFARRVQLDFVAGARKPRPTAFVEAMHRHGRVATETVMIGDQLFTDVQGGNRAGLYTILVVPIDRNEWWGTKMVRTAERVVMRILVRRGLTIPENPPDRERA